MSQINFEPPLTSPNEIDPNFKSSGSFADLFEKSSFEKKENSVVKGTIVDIEKEHVLIDVGLKSYGRVPLREFMVLGKLPELKVGDEVDVYIDRLENRQGNLVLSREKALRESSWKDLEACMNRNEPVDGAICGKIKGGFTVDLNGVIAFLPGSQVDIRPIKDITPLMNVVQPFHILKIDRKNGNIVVSRRSILEESRAEARDELLANIKEGLVMIGTVKNITDYGAFIDLGSIDGLLHVTDISWSRINHPSEVLSVGQEVEVQIIKYNPDTKRVSLGMKQMENNPWQDIEKRYKKDTKHKGKITNIADYGVRVELEPGIEGLVHVSEMCWSKASVHPRKMFTVGQEVEVMVLDVDAAKHRMSLGIKQCTTNPWKDFADKYPVNSIVDGEVKNIVEFGLFVGFENGIDGLVHISDLTWDSNTEETIKQYKKGQQVKVKVLSIDPDKERISIGIKQLEEAPATTSDFLEGVKKGDTLTADVVEVQNDGIMVQIAEGATTFIKRGDLSADRAEQRTDRFAVGDRVDVKITSITKAQRKVTASIKALEQEERKKAIEEYGSTDSGASLGDILGAAINKAKDKEKAAKEE